MRRRLPKLHAAVRRTTGTDRLADVEHNLSALTDAFADLSEAFVAEATRAKAADAHFATLAHARARWVSQWVADGVAVSAPADGVVDALKWELSVFSQNGEDGVLLALVAAIGIEQGRCLELGASDARECTTGYLSFERGWESTLVEADEKMARECERVVLERLGPRASRVTVRHDWVTAENVMDIAVGASRAGPLDVLAIDVDGNEYWIWEALQQPINPAIVVVEYNASFGPERSATIPYDPSFVWPGNRTDRFPDLTDIVYQGASLEALCRLGDRKGYRLIGCESMGVNAFFVRADLCQGLRTRTAQEAWRPCVHRAAVGSQHEQLAALSAQPVIDV